MMNFISRIYLLFYLIHNVIYCDKNNDLNKELQRLQSPLGPYNISMITVSGLSSGGYMAVQMHLSHSVRINGAAIFAGVS